MGSVNFSKVAGCTKSRNASHMGRQKVKTSYFLKLKNKGKKKPFSRDSRVRRSRSEVFHKIAVPSKLAKFLKNICEGVRFILSKAAGCRPATLY